MAVKVLLCDSAEWLGQLQYALMRSGADLQIEVVTDGFRAVEAASRSQPDVVVTEIALDGLGAADLIRRLLVTVPETQVLCWTVLPSPVTAGEMLGAGASGYVLKEDGPDAVLRAIRSVLEGNVTLSHRVALQLAERFVSESGQREHLESSLSQTSEELARLTTAKGDFLANISHELRTPITVAKGIAYVLKNRGIPEEEQEEFLAKLESSLDKLMMLVDEMLTIADLDRGTLALKISEVDLSPLLYHAVEEIHRIYPEVDIQTQIPRGLRVSADAVRIAEVTRQILDNACRYSPADEAVEVRARSMSEGVVVSITDRGRGVERQLIAQAFNEPFSTSEDILTKERDGAGVGLHMARGLIRQHGGIIWADPLPAGGTRVSFCLPARSGEELTGPPWLSDEPADASTPAGGDDDTSVDAPGFVTMLPNAATSPNG